jgi:hypothetical protein
MRPTATRWGWECDRCGASYKTFNKADDCCDADAIRRQAQEEAQDERDRVADIDNAETQKQIDLYKARRGLME